MEGLSSDEGAVVLSKPPRDRVLNGEHLMEKKHCTHSECETERPRSSSSGFLSQGKHLYRRPLLHENRSFQSHCSLILATASVMSLAWVPNGFLQVHPVTTSPQTHAYSSCLPLGFSVTLQQKLTWCSSTFILEPQGS